MAMLRAQRQARRSSQAGHASEEQRRIDQRIINLYDRFTHGFINRREFLDRLGALAGSAAAAAALLPLLQNDPARAAAVAPDDLRLLPDMVTYPAPDGTKITSYLVRAKNQ